MDNPSQEPPLLGRQGIRKDCRGLDRQIWLWTVGKKLTKRQIQQYAKEAHDKAGFSSFKASDGWYRRWISRWKSVKDSARTQPEKTETSSVRLNQNPTANTETCKTNRKKSIRNSRSANSNSIASCSTATLKSDELPTDEYSKLETQDLFETLEDLIGTADLSELMAEPAMLPKRKIERYMPHFKEKVVSYAKEFSIKDAVFMFKVHRSTVTDWMRESQKTLPSASCSLTNELRPDREFVEWLRLERLSGRLITRDLIKHKFRELLDYSQDALVPKGAAWFFKYADRFRNTDALSTSHIMYPLVFKQELAKLCEQWSKKTVSRVFNVDRKRITNWAEMYGKSDVTKASRKVEKYLTDDKIDANIWNWYSKKFPKPDNKQIREKAVKIYRKAGYNFIKCSPGWYYRWRKRYLLPSSTTEKREFDDQLICWILGEFDDNKSISHAQLTAQAEAIKGGGVKLSPSWIVRFLKRHSNLVRELPSPTEPLPAFLEIESACFQNAFFELLQQTCTPLENIIAFDEIPINFSTAGGSKPKQLLRKSGFENCHASLIVVCSADGALHPVTLILKEDDTGTFEYSDSNLAVKFQPQGIATASLLSSWFAEILQRLQRPCIFICDSYAPHRELFATCGDILKSQGSTLQIIPKGCSSRLLPTAFGISSQIEKTLMAHWEKWLQETCWSTCHTGVKLPGLKEIANWVSLAHDKCSLELKGLIKDSFAGILRSHS
ncbi:pogo transposable element with KRAB domain [Nesidiocoris tenuis]|uniref:Pogo transposable element with KRAB domain n=1 Tax=Nesidiocoris tenuis TaxID=355587 RepID=A0ABN7AZ52_9HEMI|nr:pogo transposable element with KRAB domain [Nesidiocoris tenuis]